jgi:hypothetical protein
MVVASVPVAANEQDEALAQSPTTLMASAAILPVTEAPAVEPTMQPRLPRHTLLPALYASFSVLQALDVHSTLRALDAGAAEANPAMKAVASNPTTLIAVKTAAAVGAIYLTEKVLKRKNRMAAILLMVGMNSVQGFLVARNYRVGSGTATNRR